MTTKHHITKLTIAGTTALATILFVPSFSSHGGVTPCFAQSGGGAGVGVGINGAGTSTGAKTGVNGNVSGDPGLTGNTSGDAGLKGNTSGDPGLTGNTHSNVPPPRPSRHRRQCWCGRQRWRRDRRPLIGKRALNFGRRRAASRAAPFFVS